MQIIPLKAVDSQTVRVKLANQACTINVYQKSVGLFLDLLVNDVPVISGRLCLIGARLVQDEYLGFIGDLTFLDTMGSDDPVSSGLGSRFSLAYIEAV